MHRNEFRKGEVGAFMADIEFGLDTFGGVTTDAEGSPVPHPQVIRDVVEQAVLADRAGLGFLGLGGPHRPDFAGSSPDMVLAGIACRTARLRLGRAVTERSP